MLVGTPTTLMQNLWIASRGNSYSKGGGGRIAFLTGRGGHEFDIGLLRKEDVGKAHGSTTSVVTKAATEDCQTRSSSKTPHVATEDGLSVSTKCVALALDKDAKSDRSTT